MAEKLVVAHGWPPTRHSNPSPLLQTGSTRNDDLLVVQTGHVQLRRLGELQLEPQKAKPMETEVILVPYDSGLKNFRMGNGPAYIVNFGLKKRGLSGMRTKEVSIDTSLPLEVGTTLQVARVLASAVAQTVKQGRFPLVLAGGCMSSIGTLAGLSDPPALIWLDAHGDFNTPDTTVSGFFDGMALATATGRCWQGLIATIPGFRQVPESHAILVGARAFDPIEHLLLKSSAITVIEPQAVRDGGAAAALEPGLKRLRALQARVYLHIDLDVLDVGRAGKAVLTARAFSHSDRVRFKGIIGRFRQTACVRLCLQAWV